MAKLDKISHDIFYEDVAFKLEAQNELLKAEVTKREGALTQAYHTGWDDLARFIDAINPLFIVVGQLHVISACDNGKQTRELARRLVFRGLEQAIFEALEYLKHTPNPVFEDEVNTLINHARELKKHVLTYLWDEKSDIAQKQLRAFAAQSDSALADLGTAFKDIRTRGREQQDDVYRLGELVDIYWKNSYVVTASRIMRALRETRGDKGILKKLEGYYGEEATPSDHEKGRKAMQYAKQQYQSRKSLKTGGE